jgi:hypothetical protein
MLHFQQIVAISVENSLKKVQLSDKIPAKCLPLHPIKKEENLPESLKFFRCLI